MIQFKGAIMYLKNHIYKIVKNTENEKNKTVTETL